MSSIFSNRADTAWIHWNDVALNDLNSLTVVEIVKIEGDGSAAETMLSKDSGLGGPSFVLRRRITPNDTSLEITRNGAVDETLISNNSTVATGNWYWIGYRGVFASSPELYVGTPHVRPTEVAYVSRTSGSVLIDTTSNWEAGRLYDATEKFGGRTAFLGLANRLMSAKELLSHWPIPRNVPGAGWVLFTWPGYYDALSAIDWSGAKRNGTVHASSLRTGAPTPWPITGVRHMVA